MAIAIASGRYVIALLPHSLMHPFYHVILTRQSPHLTFMAKINDASWQRGPESCALYKQGYVQGLASCAAKGRGRRRARSLPPSRFMGQNLDPLPVYGAKFKLTPYTILQAKLPGIRFLSQNFSPLIRVSCTFLSKNLINLIRKKRPTQRPVQFAR
jgi:hypothetical protein